MHIYISVKYGCVSRQYVPSAKFKAQSHLLEEIVMAKYRWIWIYYKMHIIRDASLTTGILISSYICIWTYERRRREKVAWEDSLCTFLWRDSIKRNVVFNSLDGTIRQAEMYSSLEYCNIFLWNCIQSFREMLIRRDVEFRLARRGVWRILDERAWGSLVI